MVTFEWMEQMVQRLHLLDNGDQERMRYNSKHLEVYSNNILEMFPNLCLYQQDLNILHLKKILKIVYYCVLSSTPLSDLILSFRFFNKLQTVKCLKELTSQLSIKTHKLQFPTLVKEMPKRKMKISLKFLMLKLILTRNE